MTAQPGDKATREVIDPPVAERIIVGLIPAVSEDLQRLQKRTGLSKADIVNRAVTLYEFIDAHLSAGSEVLIRDKRTGETRPVRFL